MTKGGVPPTEEKKHKPAQKPLAYMHGYLVLDLIPLMYTHSSLPAVIAFRVERKRLHERSYRRDGDLRHGIGRGSKAVQGGEEDEMEAKRVDHEEVATVTVAEDERREAEQHFLERVEHVDRAAAFLFV